MWDDRRHSVNNMIEGNFYIFANMAQIGGSLLYMTQQKGEIKTCLGLN